MIIVWTKMFHDYFYSEVGEKYYYKDKNNRRYKKINGERKVWKLNECIKKYQNYKVSNKMSVAVIANLKCFIQIRNKI